MSPTSALFWAARLLESGELGEPDPLWAAIRRAAQKLDWPDCGARLVAFRLEVRPHAGERTAAHAVAAILPTLRPKGWDSAPRGTELAEAVLEAYRSGPWHPDPISRVADDKHAYPQRPGLSLDLRLSPTAPPDEAEGRLGAKNGRKLDSLAEPTEPLG